MIQPNQLLMSTIMVSPKLSANLMRRAETVAEKPSFHSAFKARPCLVPADGFYEWKKIGADKQPFFITTRDKAPFAFACPWEWWWVRSEIF